MYLPGYTFCTHWPRVERGRVLSGDSRNGDCRNCPTSHRPFLQTLPFPPSLPPPEAAQGPLQLPPPHQCAVVVSFQDCERARSARRKRRRMGINLGETVPDFTADSSQGEINFYEYIEGSWAILFSHPNDFTPVCTTELGSVGALLPEFEKRGVKVLALSCNTVESHKAWIEDIESYTPGAKVGYPILADPGRELAIKWGMVDPAEKDAGGIPLTARAVFVIGPDKKLKLSILYPATTGRNFNEVLRVIDSLQLTANHSVATPVNWQHGDKVMVVPSLSDEAANAKFPKGFEKATLPSGKGYIRLTPQPNIV